MGKKKIRPSGLVQRGDTYYFRLDLPVDVRPIFDQTAVWESLGTSDYDVALTAWAPMRSEWMAKIAAARTGTLRYIDADLAERIATIILTTAKDGLLPIFGSFDEISAKVAEAFPSLCKIAGIPRWSDADVMAVRDRVADRFIMNLRAQGGDPVHVQTQASFANAADALAHQQEKPIATTKPIGLLDAFATWKAVGSPRLKTQSEFESACKDFIKVNGDLPLVDLTEDHFVEFKKHLDTVKSARTGKPLAQMTRNKRMGGVKAVVQAAIDNRDLKVHPGANVVVAKGKRSKLRVDGLFDHEIEALFTSPVYTEGFRPANIGEAAYWVPVLAFFTGARQSELCQLMVADVVKRDGIVCLRITDDESEGQHVKTEGSIRLVPLADKVLELGFMKYTDTLNAKGKLFPDVKADVHGVAGGLFSKWYGKYRREIGLDRKGGDFHAIRHGAKTALRGVAGDGETKLEITGHSSGNVSSGYGRVSVRDMKRIVDQIAYNVRIPKWKRPNTTKTAA